MISQQESGLFRMFHGVAGLVIDADNIRCTSYDVNRCMLMRMTYERMLFAH